MKAASLLILLTFFAITARSQTDAISIYYSKVDMPAFLKTQYYGGFDPAILASDLADLLQQATGKTFRLEEGTAQRKKGIVLEIDSNLKALQPEEGILESNGKDYVRIKARYATGLSYAMYSWIKDLGFRFYLPGTQWIILPRLSNPFSVKVPLKKYRPAFAMRMFLSSGGNYAVRGLDDSKQMEKDWQTWHRRNRMGCSYLIIEGHVGELFNIQHREQIEKEPGILAPVDGKRQFRTDGKIDPTNPRGVTLFADWVADRYRDDQKRWPWFLPPKKYSSADAGDGLNYCHTPECDQSFASVADQSFYIVNQAAKAVGQVDPDGGVSTLAYTERADTPGIRIDPRVHVMVVASAFQQVSTPTELMNRWIKKCRHVSQYDYLNIGVWNWDQPFFNLYDYHAYLQFLRKKSVEGIHYESSYSALASGVQQYFILQYLCDPYTDINKELDVFCTSAFGKGARPMKNLLKEWYFSSKHLKTNYDHPVFYPDELGRFFAYTDTADQLAGSDPAVRARIRELRLYNTYLCQYYELFGDPAKIQMFQKNPEEKKRAARDVLRFTWQLYPTRMFHNTQLNDMLKTLLDDAEKPQWDYRHSAAFAELKQENDGSLDAVAAAYRKMYLPKASAYTALTDAFLKKLIPHSADSIRISTMDETAFVNFSYPLTLYASRPGILKISYSMGEPERPAKDLQKRAVISLEKTDYSSIQTHYLYPDMKKGTIQLKIHAAGHYRLFLSQYQATHMDYVIYPKGQILYHHKKSILMNGLRMQEPLEKDAYPNRLMAIALNRTGQIPFAMLSASSNNQSRFFDRLGKSIPVHSQASTHEYLAGPAPYDPAFPFIFYENNVYRWPPVLLHGPDLYLYLRSPNGRK